ncbi:MAG TPA: Xaa-Pro peptidase family protein [Gaiellaceae bacterium]|jgi:Xaa-Pro aminopeptidase|nr:Xaa-Pro peptidase family protein [Gaiellaceae bacterium]
MTDILIYGDTVRSPELRHEIPITIPDPFLYAERNGDRHVYVSSLELARVRELDGLQAHPYEEVGWDELIASGMHREEIYKALVLNACRAIGVTSATVPRFFPVDLADHLRAEGIELTPARQPFAKRRRVKSQTELDGIRRAQRACEAAMDAARELLRAAEQKESGLEVDGKPLTSEWLKRRIGEVFTEHDMIADEFIVSHGPQSAIGHEMGSGQIQADEPIVIDLWPRDRETSCYADMTRTYVVGEAPPALVEFHRLVHQALVDAIVAIKPGVPGRDVFVGTCEFFQQHGYRTALSKEPGEVLEDGFKHGLGHGVGLEVHEEPGMGLASRDPLEAGDVVTVEPGLYNPGFGGCRLEDLILVTADGAENLTDYPYDLTP